MKKLIMNVMIAVTLMSCASVNSSVLLPVPPVHPALEEPERMAASDQKKLSDFYKKYEVFLKKYQAFKAYK